MARYNNGIYVPNNLDPVPTDAQGGYAGGDSTAAQVLQAGAAANAAVSTMENLKVAVNHLPSTSGPTIAVTGSVPSKTITIGVPEGKPGRDGMGYAQGQQLLADSAAAKAAAGASEARVTNIEALTAEVPDQVVATVAANPETQTAATLKDRGSAQTSLRDWLPGRTHAQAMAAAVDYLATKARVSRASGSRALARGMGTLHIPAGIWDIDGTLLANYYGLTIQGEDRQRTILRVTTGTNALEIWRGGNTTVRDLTLACGAPNSGEGALVENSCAVYFHELAADQYGGGNTLANRFERVTFTGFHRAVRFEGDQMTDSATFHDCRFVDNFLDFWIDNPQALNERVYDSEFVAIDETKFANALASWSAASKMTTAPGASNTLRDGAVVYSRRGGEMTFVNCSIIAHKTTCLHAPPPGGTGTAAMTARFTATTWELRVADTGDTNGLSRVSLLRREDPFAAAAQSVFRGYSLHVRDSRWTPLVANAVIAAVTSSDHVTFDGVRQLGNVSLVTRLQSVIHGQTASNPGVVRASGCALLEVVNVAASGVTPDRWRQNDVRQRDVRARPDQTAYNQAVPLSGRTGGANRPSQVQRAEVIWGDGRHLAGSPSAAGAGQTLNIGAGSMVAAVGITIGNAALTGTVTLDIEVDGVVVGQVSATPTGTPTVTATATGMKVAGGPTAVTQVQRLTQNGTVRLVRKSNLGAADETGTTWVEWF